MLCGDDGEYQGPCANPGAVDESRSPTPFDDSDPIPIDGRLHSKGSLSSVSMGETSVVEFFGAAGLMGNGMDDENGRYGDRGGPEGDRNNLAVRQENPYMMDGAFPAMAQCDSISSASISLIGDAVEDPVKFMGDAVKSRGETSVNVRTDQEYESEAQRKQTKDPLQVPESEQVKLDQEEIRVGDVNVSLRSANNKHGSSNEQGGIMEVEAQWSREGRGSKTIKKKKEED